MSEKVILEGRSAEDLIDLFRREEPLTAEIKAYFTSYCDCDVVEWIIAQLEAGNQEVDDKIRELIAAYDPYPVTRTAKFPVHGHLVKTFCEGSDLKGFFAVNSQGLQSYDKKVIIANSPLCGVYIIKDNFSEPSTSSGDIASHVSQVGLNVYRDPQYDGMLAIRPREIFVLEPLGLTMYNGFNYFGNNIESIFETQGFSFVESIPWTKRKILMSTTAFFPLKQGSTELADWPTEVSLGFGFGGDPASPVPNTWTDGGVRTIVSFHRYDAAGAAARAADPDAHYPSRFDPRSNGSFGETWFDMDAGFPTPTNPNQPDNIHKLDNGDVTDFIANKIQAAIAAGTVTGHYRSVADGNGNIPIFFTYEKRTVGGDLLGYELTFSVIINADTKMMTTYVNDVEIETFPFTVDFREMQAAWYPQVYYTAYDKAKYQSNDKLGIIITDLTIKEAA